MLLFEDIYLAPADSRNLSLVVKFLNNSQRNDVVGRKLTTISEQEQELSSMDWNCERLYVAHFKNEPFGFVKIKKTNDLARTYNIFSYAEDGKCAEGNRKIIAPVIQFEINSMRVEKLTVELLSTSQDTIKVYEDAGFRLELRKRQHRLVGGKLQSTSEFALLARDYGKR